MNNQKIKIAVVDDEPNVVESFKMILSLRDYECIGFSDGKSFLNNLKKDEYDIAFFDYKLPEMDGIELLRRTKEIDPNIEVIIVTAYATDASHANAITLGALEYLRKPFLMEEIYELVERALKRRRIKGIKKEPTAPPPSGIH